MLKKPKIQLPKVSFSSFSQVFFVIKEITKLIWSVNRRQLILVSILSAFWGLTTLPNLYITKAILDTVIGAIGQTNLQTPLTILVFLLVARTSVNVFRSGISRILWYFRWQLQIEMDTHMDIIVGTALRRIDVATAESPQFNDRLERVRRGYNRLWSLTRTVTTVPDQLLGLISASIPIFLFSKFLLLITLFLSIPGFLVDSRLIKQEFELDKILTPLNRLWDTVSRNLVRPSNLLEPRLLDNTSYLVNKVRGLYYQLFSLRRKQQVKRAKLTLLSSLPITLFTLFLDLWLLYGVILQKLTLGTGQMISNASSSFQNYLSDLLSSLSVIYDNYLYMTDLVWLTNLNSSMPTGHKTPSPVFTKGIEFKNVWFRYKNSQKWILKDVSFTIGPKENLAIIGENGAGKTTLIKLLGRFYLPDKGEIFVNGVNIQEYKEHDYWRRLSILFQDFERYAYTARESIGMGNLPRLNQTQEIESAATQSGIWDYLSGLPKKLETPLIKSYENGVEPSGGQWQRIALARAFFRHHAQVVILDEPTSNVDPKAEEEIFEKVVSLTRNKNLILISHRFSTVRLADKIIVLDKGQIAEQGTHDELIKKKGQYAKLYNLQARWYQT